MRCSMYARRSYFAQHNNINCYSIIMRRHIVDWFGRHQCLCDVVIAAQSLAFACDIHFMQTQIRCCKITVILIIHRHRTDITWNWIFECALLPLPETQAISHVMHEAYVERCQLFFGKFFISFVFYYYLLESMETSEWIQPKATQRL